MNINLLFETILILFAILASNGILYSLSFFKLNKNEKNSSENISVITNNSEKNGLTLTSIIASNPIRLTSSDSNVSETLSVTSSNSSASETLSVTSSDSSASQTLSVTSSDTYVSETLSVTSSDTYVSQDIFDNEIDLEIGEGMMTHTQNSYLSGIHEGILPSNVDVFDNTTSIDSITILNSQSFEQWREIAMDLYELPVNTPAGILQQVKFEELNILYSQDIIHFGITQTELRLIIEHFPAMSLFNPEINQLILTIMSYYHL
jgi:hypothetical protein